MYDVTKLNAKEKQDTKNLLNSLYIDITIKAVGNAKV